MAADGRDQVSGIQGVPPAGKPGSLPIDVGFGEWRSANAEQARQDCRAVGSDRERHLGKLRAADLVRYDTDGKQVRYWLKHKRDTSKLRIPTQIDTHSVCKSAPIPIEIGTCSDANRPPCLG
jgi:hypothetical protein